MPPRLPVISTDSPIQTAHDLTPRRPATTEERPRPRPQGQLPRNRKVVTAAWLTKTFARSGDFPASRRALTQVPDPTASQGIPNPRDERRKLPAKLGPSDRARMTPVSRASYARPAPMRRSTRPTSGAPGAEREGQEREAHGRTRTFPDSLTAQLSRDQDLTGEKIRTPPLARRTSTSGKGRSQATQRPQGDAQPHRFETRSRTGCRPEFPCAVTKLQNWRWVPVEWARVLATPVPAGETNAKISRRHVGHRHHQDAGRVQQGREPIQQRGGLPHVLNHGERAGVHRSCALAREDHPPRDRRPAPGRDEGARVRLSCGPRHPGDRPSTCLHQPSVVSRATPNVENPMRRRRKEGQRVGVSRVSVEQACGSWNWPPPHPHLGPAPKHLKASGESPGSGAGRESPVRLPANHQTDPCPLHREPRTDESINQPHQRSIEIIDWRLPRRDSHPKNLASRGPNCASLV